MKNMISWVKASRLPAQTFIFPSLLLGQVIYSSIYGNFSWWNFIWIHLYGLFMHFFIVYANDYADFETDQLNDTFTPFTGGSRVLVDGNLSRKNLFLAGVLMSLFTMMVGTGLSIQWNSFLPVVLSLGGIFLLYAYSFKPFQVSYRGFGETLQMVGVGGVLPLFGYVAQGGNLSSFPWVFILMILPSQLAMAISTSLPDEPSDRKSMKRTSVVLLGAVKAKGAIILLYVLSFVIFLVSGLFDLGVTKVFVFLIIIACLILLQFFVFLLTKSSPGSKSLFALVTVSILTNTAFVLGNVVLLLK